MCEKESNQIISSVANNDKVLSNVFNRLAKLGRDLRNNEYELAEINSRESTNSHGQCAVNIASEGQFTAN
jgi:hypothetical protein